MKTLNFRDLTAGEIEARIGTINEKGLTLLLYKNSRVDMAILDETVGAWNWQREHYECKGNLFCRVGVRDPETVANFNPSLAQNAPEWIWKSDCGTESNTEKEKGEASDSFKRACVNWGIGRELYTAPFIWIPVNDKEDKPNYKLKDGTRSNKPATYDKFVVEKIKIEDKKIVSLEIRNETQNKLVFSWEKGRKKPIEQPKEQPTETHIKVLIDLAAKKGVAIERLLAKYKIKAINDISMADYTACVKGLEAMGDV